MTDLVPQIGFGFAFLAGLVSFLSPCVLPLVPGYVSYVSGVSIDDMEKPGPSQIGNILSSSSLFVLGFTIVFVSLGTSASLLGGLAENYRQELTLISGIVMIVMGILLTGVIPISFLDKEFRFHPETRQMGKLGGIPLGMAFALGWLPCIGPILASILFYAGTVETVFQGTLLLLVYSLGLGLAFIISGTFLTKALRAFRWVRSHRKAINITGGAILVAMGILILTNRFFFISLAIQKLFYQLFD